MKKFPTGRLLKDKFIRMRESFKRFVQTWICFISWSRIMTPKRFVSFCDWQIRLQRFANPILKFKLWIRFVTWTSKDSTCFHESNKSSWILTNPWYYSTKRILTNPGWQTCNPDSQIRTLKICFADSIRRAFFQKICFADSICRTFSKRFVSWIRFVRPKFLKDSIHFDSEEFV